jgi:aspartokinase
MEKLKIGGLKQSLELCQFDLRGSDSSEEIASGVSKLLASQEINMELLTYYPNKNRCHQFTFCISHDKFSTASRILDKEGFLPMGWEINSRGHVGTITIFPHQSAIKILGIILASWAAQLIPIHGIASSLSALSFVTDYHLIDKATEVIQDLFQLPDDHAPFKPEIRYRQSTEVEKGKGD